MHIYIYCVATSEILCTILVLPSQKNVPEVRTEKDLEKDNPNDRSTNWNTTPMMKG